MNILSLLLKIKLRLREDHVRYADYQAALNACPEGAYSNQLVCNVVADKTKALVNSGNDAPQSTFLLEAIHQYLKLNSKTKLHILDFGGGCGVHYWNTRSHLPANLQVKWVVVETPSMVSAARTRALHGHELIFCSSLSEVKLNIDLIYSSSALQYVQYPYAIAQQLIRIGANKIIFDRMMFTSGQEEWILVQHSLLSENGPGKLPAAYADKIISYPHTTLVWASFLDLFLRSGYSLGCERAESTGRISTKVPDVFGKAIVFVQQR